MAHRVVLAALIVSGLVLLPSRPLVSLILLGAALVVALNRRGTFGSGMYRAILAFVAALWLTLVGVVATLLGLVPGEPANFLLLPGVMLLGAAVALLVWCLSEMWRIRRGGPRRGGREGWR